MAPLPHLSDVTAHLDDVISRVDRSDLQRRDGDCCSGAAARGQSTRTASHRQEGAVPVGIQVGPIGIVIARLSASGQRDRNRK